MSIPFQLPRTRRQGLQLLAAITAAACGGNALSAEAWPGKTVRIIVPFAPGGGADGSARVLAEVLAQELGQSVIVENKPGAGSVIGVMAALQSRDGHTLLMGSNSMLINPFLNPAARYDAVRDFDAVGMVSSQPLVLVVPATAPHRSVAELVAYAKAHPGQLSAGNSGSGTLAHIASESFGAQTGAQLTPVAYKGESALLPDLISGLVSLGFLNLPSVLPHIKSGRLRALAVSSAQPVAELPQVPTLASLGYPGLQLEGWAALVSPKGSIPDAALVRLNELTAKALRSPSVRERFAVFGVTPMVMGREEAAKFLRGESERYAAIVRTRGIKAQ